jgi:hypothetical protein
MYPQDVTRKSNVKGRAVLFKAYRKEIFPHTIHLLCR